MKSIALTDPSFAASLLGRSLYLGCLVPMIPKATHEISP